MAVARRIWILGLILGCGLGLAGMRGAWAESPLDTLTVRIENVGTRGGVLQVAVFDEAGYNGDMVPVVTRALKPAAGTVTTTFVGIARGVYCVRVVQDVSRDAPKNARLLGLNAPIGYSVLAGAGGKPPFRAVRFRVDAGDNQTIVRMRD